jgi:hypothetical protein
MHYQNLIQRKVQELKLQSTSSPSLGEYSYPPTTTSMEVNPSLSAASNSMSSYVTSTYTAYPGVSNIAPSPNIDTKVTPKKHNSNNHSKSHHSKDDGELSDAHHPNTTPSNNNNNSGSSNNRASKSLAEISKRFVTHYGKDNTLDYIAGNIDPLNVTSKLEIYCLDDIYQFTYLLCIHLLICLFD